jgi:tRNA pseudouridine55 synthase
MTSHDVVASVRRTLGERRAGHTGTLDPFATGLLVVLLGRGTRLARFVEGRDKTYLATARLGVATDTDDVTGTVIGGTDRKVPDAELDAALRQLTGPQRQRPPAYSAKHVEGRRSYQLARRGEAVELPPVDVMVHELEVLERQGDLISFRTRVSAGTYVRALARDLGDLLGTGAHLTALRRERIGRLDLSGAMPLAELTGQAPLRPLRDVVPELPAVTLDADAAADVRHGRPVPCADADAPAVALLAGERLIGIAERTGGVLHPRVMLEDPA